MTVTLELLVAAARETMERDRRTMPPRELAERLRSSEVTARPQRRLRRALRGSGMTVIAEIKAASPVAGTLRRDVDPVAIARRYTGAGAAAISVLTEERYFGGSLEDLRRVADAVEVPVLRKDFIVDAYQVYQAALAGASAVLLIAEVLSPAQLQELVAVAHEVHLDALVEVHGMDSLGPASDAASGIIGVNNRNLDTMAVDWEHSLRVAASLPTDVCRVAESGIRERGQLTALEGVGYDAVLVGTTLMTSDDPGAALRALLGEVA